MEHCVRIQHRQICSGKKQRWNWFCTDRVSYLNRRQPSPGQLYICRRAAGKGSELLPLKNAWQGWSVQVFSGCKLGEVNGFLVYLPRLTSKLHQPEISYETQASIIKKALCLEYLPPADVCGKQNFAATGASKANISQGEQSASCRQAVRWWLPRVFAIAAGLKLFDAICLF